MRLVEGRQVVAGQSLRADVGGTCFLQQLPLPGLGVEDDQIWADEHGEDSRGKDGTDQRLLDPGRGGLAKMDRGRSN